MQNPFDTFHPAGFHTLNAYLFVDEPAELIEFLKKAFYAQELARTEHKGIIFNCSLQIGDSSLMISQAREPYTAQSTSFYFFVADTDAMYVHALAQGALHEMEPADMPYGDRQAGVKDPTGNIWWITTRLIQEDY